jgi:hypothetical protein
MLLQELKDQARRLSVGDRLELVRSIIESMEHEQIPIPHPQRTAAIRRMKGLLKTNQPTPTDVDVAMMLEQHRVEKYF